MKKMKSSARIAALAAVSAAGLTLAQSAQAQVWIEMRTWPGPRVYEEAPVYVYRESQRYAAPAPLSRHAVRRIVERRGFEVIGPIRFTGHSYIMPVEDMRGRALRIVVDASSGELVERLAASGPRPPADIGRPRDRYAVAPSPYATDLPAPPRGEWRGYGESGPVPPPAVEGRERMARERFARQFPDGAEAPRSDFETAPGLGAAAPRAAPRAAEKKKGEPLKPATKAPQKAKPRQEAARTAPDKAESASKPAAPKGAVKTEPPKGQAANAAPLPAPAQNAAPKPGGKESADRSNASILRRPSAKADEEKTGERKGVAQAPVISSGAEPQRKSPRVVYPGPGAPAPAASPANESEQ
ncbi:MAG: hypothetical protein ACK4MV_14375 [Beijerinckiaceae bacterium]